jgi:hypothetical protein
MLVPGEFTLKIETPGKGIHEESLVIGTTPKVVSTDVLLGSAVVTMSEIRTGIIVTIDGKITPKNELYGGVGVSAGSHLLSFHTQNGESLLLPIILEDDATLDITPSIKSFLRTPRLDGKLTEYQLSRSPVIPIISAITLAGGIILNLDSVAGAIGRTYDGYSTVKYVSLGLMGTSVVALSISTLLLLLQGD